MPAIVLLTDFGSKDYFVGVMKGVISTINPVARIIDLTHDIRPQNVSEAAFAIWASRKYFPDDAVFVAVVDPGVGSERRIICARLDGQIFIAPDNGLLDFVIAEATESEFHSVTNRKLFLPTVSSTFHGRDIFAPVAAHLSRGLNLNELGEHIRYRRVERFYAPIASGKNVGRVVYHDRFGNVFTSFLWDDALLSGQAAVTFSGKRVKKFFRAYSAAPANEVVGVQGSSGLLELAINGGNAAKSLKSVPGQIISLTLK